jgi:hypothetical protein
MRNKKTFDKKDSKILKKLSKLRNGIEDLFEYIYKINKPKKRAKK